MKLLIAALISVFITTSLPAEAGAFKKAVKSALIISAVKKIIVSKKRFPESAKHIEDAQKSGALRILTIDRAGAAKRRKAALRGRDTKPGLD